MGLMGFHVLKDLNAPICDLQAKDVHIELFPIISHLYGVGDGKFISDTISCRRNTKLGSTCVGAGFFIGALGSYGVNGVRENAL